MTFKNKLIWAAAGSAALALGGLALWWWKRRASSGAEETDEVPDRQQEAELDDWDPASEGLAGEVPFVDLSAVKRSAEPEPAAEPEPEPSPLPRLRLPN